MRLLEVLDPLLSNFAPTFSLIVVKVARAAVMLQNHGPRIVLRVLLRLFFKLVVNSSN